MWEWRLILNLSINLNHTFYFYFMCMGVLPSCIEFHWTVVLDDCERLCGCWASNPGPLEERTEL